MYAPERIRKVWILTFELAGVVKVGGLGEAIAQIGRELAKRGLDVTVIMPSHGVYPKSFSELDISCDGDRYGLDGRVYPYGLRFLEGYIEGVRVILVGGRAPWTSAIIDTQPPYAYVEEKASLLARGVKCLAQRYGYPDIVHANDWHSALAAALLKTEAELEGYSLPIVYQIHLRGSPSYPWHYASEAWSGLRNVAQRVWSVIRHEYVSTQAVWDACWGNVECFMVRLADVVLCVSKSEVEGLVRDYGEWVRGKCSYSYNSTSWSIDEIKNYVTVRYGTSRREEIRWRVLDDLLKDKFVWGYLNPGDGDILAVSSGRLTPQKGFDLLLNAVRHLPHRVKVLILGRGVGDWGYEEHLKHLLDDLWGRAAIVVDSIEEQLYKSIVYVAHLYVLPSRYEPFGIAAIEALALGTPVVASSIGGPSEYIADLRATPLGIGLKVNPYNVHDLAHAIQSLGYMMYYSETGLGMNMIIFKELRDLVSREPRYGEKVRELAVAYIDAYFRPSHTVSSTLSCYELARRMAYYRAHA